MSHFHKIPKAAAEPGGSMLFDEAADAARSALNEAGVDFTDVDAAVCGYVYSDSSAGQAVIYRLNLTGIPVYNVNNNVREGGAGGQVCGVVVRCSV